MSKRTRGLGERKQILYTGKTRGHGQGYYGHWLFKKKMRYIDWELTCENVFDLYGSVLLYFCLALFFFSIFFETGEVALMSKMMALHLVERFKTLKEPVECFPK